MQKTACELRTQRTLIHLNDENICVNDKENCAGISCCVKYYAEFINCFSLKLIQLDNDSLQ